MPTIFRQLDDEAREYLHQFCLGVYLDGSCYAFAAGLHRLTGWPIIGLRSHEYPIRHAAVRDPDGELHDARGVVPEHRFGAPFGLRPPYDLQAVTLEDLRAIRPVTDREIDRAACLAELLWPDLPELEDCRRSRVRSFVDDLERLSRKHGIWIRSMAPAAPPCLAEGDDLEGGYAVKPSDEGSAFFIDRYFGPSR